MQRFILKQKHQVRWSALKIIFYNPSLFGVVDSGDFYP